MTSYTEYRRANPWQPLLAQAKSRAKRNGMEFSLTREDIIIPEICPIFNIPLYVSWGSVSDNSVSIDRIDNTRGYVSGNIIITSWKANKIKSQASLEEMRLLNDYLSGKINSSKTIHPALNNDLYISSLLRSAQKRAKNKNIQFTLSKSDVIIPYLCPVLNLILSKNDKIHLDDSPSIDRFNNELGYVPNNIRIISYRANILKNDTSPTDYEKVYHFYDNLNLKDTE